MIVKIGCLCLALGLVQLVESAPVCSETEAAQEQKAESEAKDGEEAQSSGWFQQMRDIGNRAGDEFSKAMSKSATAVKEAVSDDEEPEAKKESE